MARDDLSGAKIIPKYVLWMRGLVPSWVLRHSFLSLTDCWWLYNIQLKLVGGGYSCPLLMPMSELSLSPLYFNKTLLHRSSERSSLVSGPGLNSSPPEAKNPGIFSWFSNNHSRGAHPLTLQLEKSLCSNEDTAQPKVDSMDMSLSKLQETVESREALRAVVHGVRKTWTRLSWWTTEAVEKNTRLVSSSSR